MDNLGEGKRFYTWKELSQLNSKETAHVAYEGKVYDVSAFVSKHPGGIDQIMVGAGRDITQLFKAYHKDVDFKRLMKKCCVGELVDNELPVFVTESNFYSTVRAKVDGYLKQHKLNSKVDYTMFLTYCIVLASYFLSFYLMIFFHESFLFCCLFAGLSGALGTLTANTLYHDSSHFAITHHPWVWKLTSVVASSLLGTSMYIWRHQHVVGHHSYSNIEGADPDIDTGPKASSGVWRIKTSQLPLSRFMYQHIYMPFLYTMLGMKMRTQDIPDIIGGMKDDIRLNPQSLSQWAEFCGTKVVHVIYRYFVPLLFMSLWEFIIASVLYEVVFSLYLAQVTQLNHVSDMVEWPKADSEKKIHVDWAELQVAATQDYCTDSWFWTLVTGALNHQTAHHLFPGFIQSHYSWITPLVKQTCAEYGIQYNCVGSFSEGLKLHYQFLWRMGQHASNKAL